MWMNHVHRYHRHAMAYSRRYYYASSSCTYLCKSLHLCRRRQTEISNFSNGGISIILLRNQSQSSLSSTDTEEEEEKQKTTYPENNKHAIEVVTYQFGEIWKLRAYKTPHSCSRCALDHQFEREYLYHPKEKLAQINFHLKIPSVGVKDMQRGHLRHYYYQHCTIEHEDEYCNSTRNTKKKQS